MLSYCKDCASVQNPVERKFVGTNCRIAKKRCMGLHGVGTVPERSMYLCEVEGYGTERKRTLESRGSQTFEARSFDYGEYAFAQELLSDPARATAFLIDCL